MLFKCEYNNYDRVNQISQFSNFLSALHDMHKNVQALSSKRYEKTVIKDSSLTYVIVPISHPNIFLSFV